MFRPWGVGSVAVGKHSSPPGITERAASSFGASCCGLLGGVLEVVEFADDRLVVSDHPDD